MILFVLSVVLFAGLYIYHLRLRTVHKQLENIPGPPFLPFIGNALELGTNNIDALINLKRIAKEYGPVVRLCMGPQVWILLSEPKYIAQVFNSNVGADKGDAYKLFKDVTGDGLVITSGEKWRRHRRVIEPIFNSKHLAEYMAIFNENSNKLVERLKSTPNYDSVDVTDYVYDCAMKTICDTAVNENRKDDVAYLKAFDHALDLSLKRFFSIFKRIDFIYKFTSDYKRLQEYKKIIQDYIESVIARRKLDMKNQCASRVLFLDKLLSLSGNDAFTDEEITDEVKTIIGAGSDTIGGAMSFALFELAKHPDVQKKILEETNDVLGKDKSADVSFEDAQYLRYAECVYKEVLRLYPPACFVLRKLQERMKFDDMMVPAGAYVLIFIAEAQMSETHFPNPKKFDPDRHLPGNLAKRHPCAFIPFGAGPRMCIGQKYSTLEAKVMLSKIIRNFEIEPVVPEHEVVYLVAGTLKSTNGLPVRLKLRERL